jgi:hypothetical protein
MDVSKTVEVPAALLRAAGQALWGREWVGPLADLLAINRRAVERWATAARDGEAVRVSRSLVAELAQYVDDRRILAASVPERLRQLIAE